MLGPNSGSGPSSRLASRYTSLHSTAPTLCARHTQAARGTHAQHVREQWQLQQCGRDASREQVQAQVHSAACNNHEHGLRAKSACHDDATTARATAAKATHRSALRSPSDAGRVPISPFAGSRSSLRPHRQRPPRHAHTASRCRGHVATPPRADAHAAMQQTVLNVEART
jgi:hypothetical protein